MAERFRPLFDSDQEFEHTFPLLSARTNLDAVRAAQAARQLDLFSL